MHDKVLIKDKCSATVTRGAQHVERVGLAGRYHVVCIGRDGREKWRDTIENLVTTVGKNLLLNATLDNAAAGAVVMGLKGTGAANAADTQASHAGWTERGGANAPAYTGNRPAPAWAAAAAASKATSAAVSFAITSAGTIAGCFLNIGGSATKDNATGTLFSAGDFTGGDKIVAGGDTLNVSYTLTA